MTSQSTTTFLLILFAFEVLVVLGTGRSLRSGGEEAFDETKTNDVVASDALSDVVSETQASDTQGAAGHRGLLWKAPMGGLCTMELHNVETGMKPWEQVKFCKDWVKYFNMAMGKDPCDQRLNYCNFRGQSKPPPARRVLGGGTKKKGKNSADLYSKGKCNHVCPEEVLVFNRLDRGRRRLLAPANVTADMESESLSTQEATQRTLADLGLTPTIIAQRRRVMYQRLMVECNRMRIEYAGKQSKAFHGMTKVVIRCTGNPPLTC